ncbi:hypothetical protein ACHAXA_010033 [Cyclostephanos tholiformis]|uniref:Uncharacterized protein n=1 Tax=Cyclostephanos tholiformis TaxID=382380 RepID=A0ABD3RK03_9STRA
MGDDNSSDSGGGSALGPLGINPLHFSASLFVLLFLFVLYLLLPRGLRVNDMRGAPGVDPAAEGGGRRSKATMTPGGGGGGGEMMGGGGGRGMGDASYEAGNNAARLTNYGVMQTPMAPSISSAYGDGNRGNGNKSSGVVAAQQVGGGPSSNNVVGGNDDVVISAAMQQLRDPGVLIVAHGSRGKPKTVRLMLTETAITWRTEMRKKVGAGPNNGKELKLGKLHQVPLGHIMYVDIGKQTTALRRVENASVSDVLCFSLLTKEGSLDLEANSPRERDALVQCFSLVLDEVHAQNWRDIYRGPSSDMPSSFDEGDVGGGGGGGNS